MLILACLCSHPTGEATLSICGGAFAETGEDVHALGVEETPGELWQTVSHHADLRLAVYAANDCTNNKHKS